MSAAGPRHVVHVVTGGVHLLDLSGPAQVIHALNAIGYPTTQSFVGDSTSVISAQGLPLTLETGWPDLDVDDLVIVPGWSGTDPAAGVLSDELITKIGEHATRGGWVASVCSGADALGRAGLLDGRRCTTHHQLVTQLTDRYPAAHVVPDTLYVADERVWTSAGIASGIDMMLSLVAEWHGPAVAGQVSRELVVYLRRAGDDRQHSVFLQHRSHMVDVVHRAQELIERGYREPLRLDDLADTLGVSARTLTRHFERSIGVTPLAYQQAIRVEVADQLVASGATYERAATVVGLSDARSLRRLRARR